MMHTLNLDVTLPEDVAPVLRKAAGVYREYAMVTAMPQPVQREWERLSFALDMVANWAEQITKGVRK